MNIKALTKKIRAEIAKHTTEKHMKARVVILGLDDVIENPNPHTLYIRTSD